MTIHEAQQRLVFQLYGIYDNREASNIADLVMEHLTGWEKVDRILHKQVSLLTDKIALLEKITSDLLTYKPVQYVLNEAWFYGLKFFVNEHVLIPRPETEELVEWVILEVRSAKNEIRYMNSQAEDQCSDVKIFDMGTGSGCISIALKKKLPLLEIVACDVSKGALEVAQKNAAMNQTDIGLLHMNFLDPVQWEHLPTFDVIVSNPPYVPLKDKDTMRQNVLQYEPHLALFVENNDPLLFYRSIADFAKEKMQAGGSIYAEIHEELATETVQIFSENGFGNIEIKKDMQGKDRMIRVKN
ncbi:MAG: peptide chain release factor N(5)-glutamine methyltransferase [Chitinophagaceae bacterium]|nr:peptide chain release factor N(5)-glutamine methyltransferase [Chitinophagaceae bacterium]